ncbi:MAG: hypothetical protein WA860_02075 [Acidimicrobiales bacterium]
MGERVFTKRSRVDSYGAIALALLGIAASHYKWPSAIFAACLVGAGLFFLAAIFSLQPIANRVHFQSPVVFGRASLRVAQRPPLAPEVLELIEVKRLGEQLLDRLPKNTGMYVRAKPILASELHGWTARTESLLKHWPRDQRSFAGQVSIELGPNAEAPETQTLKTRLAILEKIISHLKGDSE